MELKVCEAFVWLDTKEKKRIQGTAKTCQHLGCAARNRKKKAQCTSDPPVEVTKNLNLVV